MKIEIYTHTTMKSPRDRNGVCIYVIETKELPYVQGKNPLTEMGPITDASANEAQLTTLLRALKRLKGSSDIEINSEAFYIKQMLERLQDYRRAGWKTAKGQPIKYRDIWQKVAEILEKQTSFSVLLAPVNEWSAWMESEAEQEKKKMRNSEHAKG